jgi:hemin uptake protein HemP
MSLLFSIRPLAQSPSQELRAAQAQEAQHRSAAVNPRNSFASSAPPVQSDHLLRGQKVVEIVHNGSLYKLQATKLGKLILTK